MGLGLTGLAGRKRCVCLSFCENACQLISFVHVHSALVLNSDRFLTLH